MMSKSVHEKEILPKNHPLRKMKTAKDCPYNVSEDSCPNCEREDCPIDAQINWITNNLDVVGTALIEELEKLNHG